MTGTDGWILQVVGTSKNSLDLWLSKETTGTYDVSEKEGKLAIQFSRIDDAFRFRMQFDDKILQDQ